jgi:hypothetical protein
MHEFFFQKFTKSRAGALRGNDALILPRPKVQYTSRMSIVVHVLLLNLVLVSTIFRVKIMVKIMVKMGLLFDEFFQRSEKPNGVEAAGGK